MVRYFRGVVIVAGLVCVNCGVATADPVPLQDVSQDVYTDDGYHFSALLTKMTINSVPNMAATAFSREAFVSATATEIIDGRQIPANPFKINGGKLEMALQLGCQVNLDSATQITFGTDENLGLGNVLQNLEASPQFSDFLPNITLNLQPGYIKYVTIGQQEIKPDDEVAKRIKETGNGSLRLTVHDAYITVDKCGGQVSARVVVVAQLRTENGSFDELNLYGDILPI